MSNQRTPEDDALDAILNDAGYEVVEISPRRQAPEADESGATDSFYEGFEPKALSVEQPVMPSTLDLNSALSAELTALKQKAIAEAQENKRKGTLTDPLPKIMDPARLIDFVNNTRKLDAEKIEERIVNESMPLMLWKMREYAVQGKYTETRAIEIWLNWAEKVNARPKKEKRDPGVQSGALFDATLGKDGAYGVPGEKQKATAKKKKPGPFSKAGEFIGKETKKVPIVKP